MTTLSREDQMQRKVLESMLRDDCLEKEVNTLFSKYAPCAVAAGTLDSAYIALGYCDGGGSVLR